MLLTLSDINISCGSKRQKELIANINITWLTSSNTHSNSNSGNGCKSNLYKHENEDDNDIDSQPPFS